MSFRAHMLTIVGDKNTVARYLFEKISHVSFIAIVLTATLAQPLFRAAWMAVVIYMLISKTVVRLQKRDVATFWRDGAFYRRLVFLNIACALVVVIASATRYDRAIAGVALLAWASAFLLLDAIGWSGAP